MRLNNNSVLQIFEGVGSNKYQHHKKWYSYGSKNPLLVPDRTLPAFQIIGMTTGTLVDVSLKRIETNQTFNLFNALGNPSGLPGLSLVQTSATLWNVVYVPTAQFTQATPVGEYEIYISAGGKNWESERFRIVEDVSNMVLLEWWHNSDFSVQDGVIYYGTNGAFKNSLYVNTILAFPRWETVDTVDDRDAIIFPIHQTWKKAFYIDILTTQAIADCITKIGLHHNKYVIYQGESYRIIYFVPGTPTWEPAGDLCKIECRLELGMSTQLSGDAVNLAEFNDDFGDDFNV